MIPSFSTRLLVITSAPASSEGDSYVLDKKFVEGMRYYSASWMGRVACLAPTSGERLPFAARFSSTELPFDVHLRPSGHRIAAADLEGYDIVLCGGDNAAYLHVAELCRDLGKKLFYIIEYIPQTRRQIIMLDRSRALPRKMKSLLHIELTERRRRRAFGLATGVQANGYPAADLYRPLNANTLMYLDNRIDADLLVTEAEMAARREYHRSGGPLRLLHSGRLEPMKGSQDLLPIARRLQAFGIDFVMDIFGSGSLESDLRSQISEYGLSDRVRLHGSVDFETELVPFARANSDIFLSCHRQSDPSCSYVENMGCGLAIAGYDNRMWAALARTSKAGWVAPLGDWQHLADGLSGVARNRSDLILACDAARAFAGQHLFKDEFDLRLAQLKSAVRVPADTKVSRHTDV